MDLDQIPLAKMVVPVVAVDDTVVVEVLQSSPSLILVLLNMDLVVVLLAIMLLVAVEQDTLVNHIPASQTEWDGVV